MLLRKMTTDGPEKNGPQRQSTGANTNAPRILIFDITQTGNGTATGEIKSNIFAEWPTQKYLQVFLKGDGTLGLVGADRDARSFPPQRLRNSITDFDPEVILYRPVPDASALHAFAMETIQARPNTPVVTWIMDDWPARLEIENPEQFSALNPDWLWLLDRSARRLSICDQMSATFKARYGYDFEAFANGIDASDWREPTSGLVGDFVIRYAGALADNMTARSIQRVAEAVEDLAVSDAKIRLEINTRALWKKAQARNFSGLPHTKFFTEELSAKAYREWLSDANAVLIGYNFDVDSLRYIGLSMANKLPECLASGVPLLAHGPAEAATIAYLKKMDCALVVDSPEIDAVRQGIANLMRDTDLQKTLVARARAVAFKSHDIRAIRQRFTAAMRGAAETAAIETVKMDASKSSGIAATGYSRDDKVTVDETAVVAHLLRDRTGRSHIMLDVGAHFGTSAAYFNNLGWTIHCFEPDPNNREKLVKRFGRSNNVMIDPRAVSDISATGVPFFRSDESTGISGLRAFSETHRENGRVDITTVGEIVETRDIDHIDFLKIDVEGFDYSVLKGVPWDKIHPDVIECEFEDFKTVPLGHSWEDMAQHLRDRGYTVYLSEWHPIIRYGIRHDWRRIVSFPGAEIAPGAWGNILAFSRDPGFEAVARAFEEIIVGKSMNGAADDSAIGRHPIGPRHRRMTMSTFGSRYERFVHWTLSRNLAIYRAGQFAMWCLRTARRQKPEAAALVILLAALAAGGFISSIPLLSMLSWGAAASVAVAVVLIAIIGFSGHLVQRASSKAQLRFVAQEHELRSLEKLVSDVQARLSKFEGVVNEKLLMLPAEQSRMNERVAKVEKLIKSTAVFNQARFQRFNRTLETHHVSAFISDWAKPLGLNLNEKRLGYLAHRACVLESRMKGRLATSIEAIVLRSLVASAVKRDDVSILEIGTLFGVGAAAVYESAANEYEAVHITVIDPLDGYYATGNHDLLTGAGVSEATLRQNWSLAPIPEEDFTIIKHLSSDPEAIEAASKRQYDVLIIDGDHSYGGVKFDFDTYCRMVRPGGYILFDDYDVQDWPDIKRYVDTEIEGLPHLHRVGAAFRTAVYQVRENETPATSAT